jgi:hypothetical protein
MDRQETDGAYQEVGFPLVKNTGSDVTLWALMRINL